MTDDLEDHRLVLQWPDTRAAEHGDLIWSLWLWLPFGVSFEAPFQTPKSYALARVLVAWGCQAPEHFYVQVPKLSDESSELNMRQASSSIRALILRLSSLCLNDLVPCTQART